jgi:hypothetical protein
MQQEHTTSSTLAEKDAASFLGFTPSALRAWRREGRGPAFIRIGRSVRYELRALTNHLAAHRVETRDSRMEAR